MIRRSLLRLSGLLRRVALGLVVPLIVGIAMLTIPGTVPPAAAQDAYRIAPGDVLRVEVIEDESLNRSTLVLPDGRFSFPLAGSVRAGGRTIDAVRSDLVTQLAPNFSNPPTVFVSLERLAEPDLLLEEEELRISIYVLGEVSRPGRLEIEPGTTLIQAFALMGGFSEFAATKRVQLRRRDPVTGVERVYKLNYDRIAEGTSPNGTAALAEGDVILVPTRRLFE